MRQAIDLGSFIKDYFTAQYAETYVAYFEANVLDTVCIARVEAEFSEMSYLFGPSLIVDYGDQVNEWRFTGPGGTFTIYDASIRSDKTKSRCVFCIGAASEAAGAGFKTWVVDKLSAHRAVRAQRYLA